jgi:hypothetical protein
VKESFEEYKKTLEPNLSNLSFLYNGDVLSSTDSYYSHIKSSEKTSPSFIISTIENIYNESFKMMIDKSETIVISKESIKLSLSGKGNIIDVIIGELKLKPSYIFTSDKSKAFFSSLKRIDDTRSFPGYFYNIERYSNMNLEIFYSPLIEETEGESIMYLVDSGIQSLVYSIQNMTYDIERVDEFDKWKHTINYTLYDCNYKSFKLIIKDLSKIREDKINKLLDAN